MNYGNGQMNYRGRQSVDVNIGEQRFLEWCSREGWEAHRLGFDEKQGYVSFFYKLAPALRYLPDFVITNDNEVYVVNVKGTSNIKQEERRRIDKFVEVYGSMGAELVYAFCFEDRVEVLSTMQVKDAYDEAQDKVWSDGRVYRSLRNLNGLHKFHQGSRGSSGSFDWKKVLSAVPDSHAR